MARSICRWVLCALAALPLIAAAARTSAAQGIEVRFRLALYDDHGGYPVDQYTILVISAAGDSVSARTDATGGAQLWLKPGAYLLVPVQAVEFDGVQWVWELPLAVQGNVGPVELTQKNGTAIGVAASRPGTTPLVISIPKGSRRAARAEGVELVERIARIERGLLPAVLMKGDSAAGRGIGERMAYYKVPGVSVAVIHDFRVEWARGYGTRAAGLTAPVDSATLFQAASISKPVAAAAALRLVEQGRMGLDEDVNARLVSWRVPDVEHTRDAKVTVRGILSHGAGLTVHGFRGYAWDVPLPTLREVLDGSGPANSRAVRVDAIPGSLWRYSGGGYTVLQQLMTDVAGVPFPQLMREIVLDRIGMHRSTFEQPLPHTRGSQAAIGHGRDGTQLRGRWHVYPEMAAAGLWTTATDLARFALELQQAARGRSTRLLSQATAREMLTRQKLGWGLGFDVSGEGPNAYFTHGGANEGFRCVLVAFTETGQAAVVMTNSDNGSALADEILRSIAREYRWPAFQPVERTVAAIDPKFYSEFVGQYRVRAGASGAFVTVSRDRSRLLVQLPGAEPEPVLAESDSSYVLPRDGTRLTFSRDTQGVVRWLIGAQRGARFTAQRVR